jgi:hypothetical protein
MALLGIVLLIIGLVAGSPALLTIGIILLVVGLALELLGAAGHAVGRSAPLLLRHRPGSTPYLFGGRLAA